jgi:hypothetical protein
MSGKNTNMRTHAEAVLAEQERQGREAAEKLAAGGAYGRAAMEAATATVDLSDAGLDYQIDGNEIRVDQGIAMRHFFPGGESQKWALANVCHRGKGTREVIGALMGIAHRTEDGTSDIGPYIRAVGEFFMESRLTGERRYHTDCYLPQGYAKQLKSLLAAEGAEPVKLDAVVAVEATGKPIPYAYAIYSRMNIQASAALGEMMANRSRRLTGRAQPDRIPAPTIDATPDAAA